MSISYEKQLEQLIKQNEQMMAILHTVRRCNPPEWLVGALVKKLFEGKLEPW